LGLVADPDVHIVIRTAAATLFQPSPELIMTTS
jgi:hypothetical protein